MNHALRARSFDRAAAQYAAHRPSYPPALYDALEELSGRRLAGARVVDVGAGTGIGTAPLIGRGARVVAVEPGDGMAAEFRRALPDVPLVRGDGNHLPLATGSADFVTYAQAWHWTDPARSVPEARRVLRPGGTLALWWNDADRSVPWIAEQVRRARSHLGAPEETEADVAAIRGLPVELGLVHRRVRWSRRVSLESHLANLTSHSEFLVLGEPGTSAFLAEERRLLSALFPDGTIEERYVTDLSLAVLDPGI
ncbi:class I SAM-dependent methyltransferase [Streptomyces coeruleoprunus]|uniref:Class I SAM-dependent methyltransferase n=1 Tax=Streptomyces coeruleoprunus TaxID=285563 RepID=A0ABV9XHK9_9ACTN